ncbi:N-acetylmuramoyl-L-alanine amidase [uncultured Adlercreutzia sp.]|uniref:N-acetylmuramoyl-L-alanine amidase n=1 Tax=uncultured Adlercreutzia sp. TaxID=875803 RepID=UPI0025E5182A|nr:peptidoglycan recognition family protein [uncultured Adlercreutzia sp.]
MRNLLGAAAPLLEQRSTATRRALDVVQITSLIFLLLMVLLSATACAQQSEEGADASSGSSASGSVVAVEAPSASDVLDTPAATTATTDEDAEASSGASSQKESPDPAPGASAPDAAASSGKGAAASEAAPEEEVDIDALFEDLDVTEDYRKSFVHGEKPADYQRYIVLHDTEGGDSAANVIDWWDSNGNLVAAHFIVNKDGSIWQCVPLDKIAHHAGFGDTGHNVEFGTNNEARDDKKGTTPIGDDYADYGMNSYSIGIEMVHQGGEGDYPEAQLEAVDKLIAYIDAYYGFESQIIDHKAWRSGNSDTSEEFAPYLKSYQQKRTHA